MLDRTIPYYNLILRCDRFCPVEAPLPPGIRIRGFHPGDEAAWAVLEHGIGDFASVAEAERYFTEHYCSHIPALRERGLFAVNEAGETVGSCIAWRDRRGAETVASLHWLVVLPAWQRRGIGKALCGQTMRTFQRLGEFPVYLHTQPWSYKAVALYVRQGFCLQTADTFSGYENQYSQAMAVLKTLLPEARYAELEACSQ